MFILNFNINEFKHEHLFKNPHVIQQGFELPLNALKEFYQILLNPLNGAHQSFGENRSLVKVMNETKHVEPSTWTHSFPGDQGKYRDIAAIRKAIQLKCSIIFDEYYRYSQDAKELVAFVQEAFNCTAGCNAYLSQNGGTAFSIHRDCHDVLVFALSGKKRWKIYNYKQPLNQAYNRIESSAAEVDVVEAGLHTEVIMNPGDMLYIPIGQFHSVENLSDNALHLTVSMSFKPLFCILEDVLHEIYNPIDQTTLSTNATNILNALHPVYTSEKPLTQKDLMASLKQLCQLMEEVVSKEAFVLTQNHIKRNKHLDVFVTPSSELIEELAACSE